MLNKHIKTETDEPITFTNNNQVGHQRKISQTSNSNIQSPTNKYEIDGVAGKGTFGTVYLGHVRGSGKKIAIKKVFQDKKYKNRELQILKTLKHTNLL
jgi:serine/threonine protein kinase